MAVPFDGIDPYEELSVERTASPSEIKKAYYKLCLKYHPDKLSDDKKEDQELIVRFQKIQFSYTILSDTNKRKKFDQTGSLDDNNVDDDFNWKDYFDTMKVDEITPEKIEQDKKMYQGSPDEENDIMEMYSYYDGEFIRLFECIPHSELDLDEERFLEIVQTLINEKKISHTKNFSKYKKSRDKILAKERKKASKEAKEAEELSEMLKLDKKPNSMDDLSMIIQNRNNKRAADSDAFFANLEAKYGGGAGGATKKAKKSKTSSKKSKK